MIRVKNENRGITLTYRLFERVKSESDKGEFAFDIAEKFKAVGICNGEEGEGTTSK